MMDDLLELAKEHLRIDGDQDNEMLGLFIKSSIEYLKNAGVEEQESDLYKLAVMMLVTHWYENRESVSFGFISRPITLGVQSIILQLKSW